MGAVTCDLLPFFRLVSGRVPHSFASCEGVGDVVSRWVAHNCLPLAIVGRRRLYCPLVPYPRPHASGKRAGNRNARPKSPPSADPSNSPSRLEPPLRRRSGEPALSLPKGTCLFLVQS